MAKKITKAAAEEEAEDKDQPIYDALDRCDVTALLTGKLLTTEDGEPVIGRVLDGVIAKAAGGDVKATEFLLERSDLNPGAVSQTLPTYIRKIYGWLDYKTGTGCKDLFLFGTTRSGKTYAIVQWLLDKLCRDELGVQSLIAGQTGPFLSNGVCNYINQLAPRYGLEVMQGGKEVRNSQGHKIVCQSFDNPDKVLSAQWDNVYVNEGNVIPLSVVNGLRIRNAGVFITDFNPAVKEWWGKDIMTDDNSLLCSFADNPYLTPSQLDSIEGLKRAYLANPDNAYSKWYYHVYYLGEWSALGGGVFTDLLQADNWEEATDGLATIHAIDFGDVTDPNALVQVAYGAGVLHVRCQLYETRLSDQQVCQALLDNNVQTLVFETATGGNTRALNLRNSGYQGLLIPAHKTTVQQGVANLSQLRVVCYDARSYQEFSRYSINDGRFSGADHCIDAVRYAYQHMMDSGWCGEGSGLVR